jgi:PhzF family phenazine biosynthesis protein
VVKIPLYQVDAFTHRVFGGNPAAVCVLERWLDDATLQAIALENALSETAFFVPDEKPLRIRWFTPTVEMDLCGHATLASGSIWFDLIDPGGTSVTFESLSGPLTVRRVDDRFELDFPSRPPKPVQPPAELIEALGAHAIEWGFARDYLAVFQSAEDVRALAPDIDAIRRHADVIATAPGDAEGVDFVSRFFAPGIGIDEDPVTGATHCVLVPYWAKRLKKTRLLAHQVSARGGELQCEDRGDRVAIAGHATRYMNGEIILP